MVIKWNSCGHSLERNKRVIILYIEHTKIKGADTIYIFDINKVTI